jgi:hypothetical protein
MVFTTKLTKHTKNKFDRKRATAGRPYKSAPFVSSEGRDESRPYLVNFVLLQLKFCAACASSFLLANCSKSFSCQASTASAGRPLGKSPSFPLCQRGMKGGFSLRSLRPFDRTQGMLCGRHSELWLRRSRAVLCVAKCFLPSALRVLRGDQYFYARSVPMETAAGSDRLKVRNRQVDISDVAIDHPDRHIDMD